MGDIYFDHQEVTTHLRDIQQEQEDQRGQHRSVTPAFAPADAGRDFAAAGAQLRSVFIRLYARGDERIGRFIRTAEAAREQFDAVHRGDEDAAAVHRGIDVGQWRG